MTDQLIVEKPEETSEFGRGYAYCLGLFLAHEWKLMNDKKISTDSPVVGYSRAMMWFNGAADHLAELIAPSSLPADKVKEIEKFQRRCMALRNDDYATFEDCDKALADAKRLLLEWDLFNGVDAIKGEWQ